MKKLIIFSILIFNFAVAAPKCSNEGQMAGGSTIDAMTCCEGLIYADKFIHEHIKNGCNQFPPPGSWGSCIKCGDGKCDNQNYENKCNCPKDCK
jgi:hypothetical protein